MVSSLSPMIFPIDSSRQNVIQVARTARRLVVSGLLARMCGCRILPRMRSIGSAVKDGIFFWFGFGNGPVVKKTL